VAFEFTGGDLSWLPTALAPLFSALGSDCQRGHLPDSRYEYSSRHSSPIRSLSSASYRTGGRVNGMHRHGNPICSVLSVRVECRGSRLRELRTLSTLTVASCPCLGAVPGACSSSPTAPATRPRGGCRFDYLGFPKMFQPNADRLHHPVPRGAQTTG
jgi:hypothetical protein